MIGIWELGRRGLGGGGWVEGVGWRGLGGGEARSINILWSHGRASDGACPIWSRLPSHSNSDSILVFLIVVITGKNHSFVDMSLYSIFNLTFC